MVSEPRKLRPKRLLMKELKEETPLIRRAVVVEQGWLHGMGFYRPMQLHIQVDLMHHAHIVVGVSELVAFLNHRYRTSN
jgi:hypothetical protein